VIKVDWLVFGDVCFFLDTEREGLRRLKLGMFHIYVCLCCAWCCKLLLASLYLWPYDFINLKLGIYAFRLKVRGSGIQLSRHVLTLRPFPIL
jgi:hypothetical protein